MTELSQAQKDALRAAGWTEAEALGFVQAVTTFRDGLPPRQREAFTGILAAANAVEAENDVHGHLVVIPIIAVLIGMLPPAVQKVR